MKIRGIIIATLLALGSAAPAFAQMFGGGFTLGFPQDEFGESLDRIGWGLGGEALYVVDYPNVPVGLGVDFNYFQLGTETRREPFSYTIPDLTVDVT
ncbi:MAG: hypothetical protein GF419_07225, partial [Ignavibacteriales bacterium]|nr:hypothetical protein [Ignavibacteriales bacterium]